MNFQSFGQTVKGHWRDLDGKSKGKTEQARKVRAKPMGRNQLGVKMQLSHFVWSSIYLNPTTQTSFVCSAPNQVVLI